MTAGAAAAAATAQLGPTSVFAAPQQVPDDNRLIPEDKVGTITFTQRDVPGRLAIAPAAHSAVMGFLGGANFPADPTDLGPLVPLPGGWRELFEFLAGVGYTQIEFAGYGQNAANPGGPQPNPAPGGVTTPGRAAYLAYGRRCGASSTTSGSRQSATTASSRTPGRARAALAARCRPTISIVT